MTGTGSTRLNDAQVRQRGMITLPRAAARGNDDEGNECSVSTVPPVAALGGGTARQTRRSGQSSGESVTYCSTIATRSSSDGLQSEQSARPCRALHTRPQDPQCQYSTLSCVKLNVTDGSRPASAQCLQAGGVRGICAPLVIRVQSVGSCRYGCPLRDLFGPRLGHGPDMPASVTAEVDEILGSRHRQGDRAAAGGAHVHLEAGGAIAPIFLDRNLHVGHKRLRRAFSGDAARQTRRGGQGLGESGVAHGTTVGWRTGVLSTREWCACPDSNWGPSA